MNPTGTNDTTLNEMVQLVMQEGAVPKIMEKIWNLAMQAERDAHICASHYERNAFRDGYRVIAKIMLICYGRNTVS